MNEVHEGRFIEPARAPQIREMEARQAARFPDYQEWGLTEVACAKMMRNEATIALGANLVSMLIGFSQGSSGAERLQST